MDTGKQVVTKLKSTAKRLRKRGDEKGAVLADSVLEEFNRLSALMRKMEALPKKLLANTKKSEALRKQLRKAGKSDPKLAKRITAKMRKFDEKVWADVDFFSMTKKEEKDSLNALMKKVARLARHLKYPMDLFNEHPANKLLATKTAKKVVVKKAAPAKKATAKKPSKKVKK